MDLWNLKNLDSGLDIVAEFVVRAESEDDARRFASEQAGDEGPGQWLDPALSSCEKVVKKGKAGVVVRAFVPG